MGHESPSCSYLGVLKSRTLLYYRSHASAGNGCRRQKVQKDNRAGHAQVWAVVRSSESKEPGARVDLCQHSFGKDVASFTVSPVRMCDPCSLPSEYHFISLWEMSGCLCVCVHTSLHAFADHDHGSRMQAKPRAGTNKVVPAPYSHLMLGGLAVNGFMATSCEMVKVCPAQGYVLRKAIRFARALDCAPDFQR